MKRLLSMLCALALMIGLIPAATAAESGFLKQSGHLNSAYIEWAPVEGATGYQVFVKKSAEGDSAYARLDDQLVRQYPGYWRADALGLAAGEYVMKVVPVQGETALPALVTGTLEVLSHERTGYAFFGGSVPGAYKMDGTLKDKAQVVYITEENKNSVKLGSYTGLQNIVSNVNKIGAPVDIRIIGRVTGISNSLLLIKGSTAQLTIEGVGNDATADGWGFEINSTSNMELANLAVMMVASTEGDGVTLNKATHTWVHNCDFFYNTARNDDGQGDKEKGDGSLDTKYSTYITHSYNHFWDSGKCNLQGSSISDTSDYITYHHNWYDHSDSRHPRVRVAHVHVYNNFYDNNDGYGIGAVYHATVFSDRNYFDHCKEPMLIAYQGSDSGHFTGNDGSGEDGGMIKAYGNVVVGGKYVPYSQNSADYDAYDVSDLAATVPSSVKSKRGGWSYDNFDTDAKKFYTYAADEAAAVPDQVRAYAGRVEGGDLQYDMTTLQNAGSKYPDAGLLAVLTDYTGTLVSVGGDVTDPGPVEPDPTPVEGKTYTLTGDQVFALMEAGKGPGSFTLGANGYTGSYYTSAQANHKAGTEDFFTLRYASSSRVDPVAMTFSAPDAYSGQYRINFNGGVSKTQNAVQFTTGNIATVKVWWAPVTDKTLRPMVILDESGGEVAASATSDVPTVTTFTLADPGTYYLGGRGGKNFIYRVDVTIGGQKDPDAVDQGTMTGGGQSLNWKYTVDDQVVVTGELDGEEKVLVGCYDGQNRLIGLKLLTRGELTAQMEPGIPTVKLFWLGEQQKPQCEAVTVNK